MAVADDRAPWSARRAGPWSGRHLIAGATLLLALAYLLVRLWGLDRMLNTDEPFWLGSAGRMFAGLATGDLAATFQLPHPGLPTLWSGVVAYLLAARDFPVVPSQDFYYHSVDVDLRRLGHDPMGLLVGARTVKLLVQAALLSLSAWLLRDLFGPGVALVAGTLIVFEPFLIGHDRFLHIDGMTAIASLAAVLAIGAAAGRSGRRQWMLAGALTAVAILTRFTVGVIVPVAGLLIVLPALLALACRRGAGGVRETSARAAGTLLVYGGTAVAATLVVWPALLVDPMTIADRMWEYSRAAAVEGHELPIFYGGRIVAGDPGPGFYAEAIAWRITPAVVVGILLLIVATAATAARRVRLIPATATPALIALLLFGASYVTVMEFGAKKIDRYMVPVFPILDVLAAIGIVGAAGWLWRGRHRSRRVLSAGLVALLLTIQVGAAWSDRQYGMDYYTPLLGGIDGAQDRMQLGWGEGLDQAAAFILSQPGGATAVVRSQNDPATLLYLLPASTTVLSSNLPGDAWGLDAWSTTDFYVAYLPQWERGLNPLMQDQAVRYPAALTVRIHDVAFARVYDLRTIPPPASMIASLPCRWDYSGRATLLTYRDHMVPSTRAGTSLRDVSLHFLTAAQTPVPVHVRLVPKDPVAGLVPIDLESTLLPAAAAGTVSTVHVQVELPGDRSTDAYWVDVALIDPATSLPIETRLIGGTIPSRLAASATMCPGAGAVD